MAGSRAFSAPAAGTAVAIGNFDGVHLGHRAVLAQLDAVARERGLATCVYTFEPAPTAIVAPERHQPRIQTTADRVEALFAEGVDHVVVEPFTPEFAALSAASFLEGVLRDRLRCRALVVGHDFRFGNMRAGDAAAIRRLLPEVQVREVGALCDEHGAISSSRVRKLVAAGHVEEASRLVGRPYVVTGRVVAGDKLGRTIGFPTANLELEQELRPCNGVYAARVWLDRWRPAAVNVGTRPTVGGVAQRFEVHLLDFDGDLYGQRLVVQLASRLRAESRFSSLDALRQQIALDVAAAREFLQ